MIRHDNYIKSIPAVRRKKIKERAQQLIAQEMTLRELRRARRKSQEDLAHLLGCRQGDISKLERRTDAYLSTIRRYVEAMGGTLDLIATFPNSAPIKITHVTDLD